MKKNNISASLTVCTGRRSLKRLFALEGKTPPEGAPSPYLFAFLALRFDFLRVPLLFDIDGDTLVMSYPADPERAVAKAAKLSERASKLAGGGDYKGAVPLWHRALEAQPSLHGARRDLANAYYKLGKLEEAKRLLLEVVWWDLDDHCALIALGTVHFRQDDLEAAERFTRLALALEPEDAAALNIMALMCERKGRSEDAVALLRRATEIQPDLPQPHLNLAWILAEQRKFDESAAAIRRLFASGGRNTADSARILAMARQLFITSQQELARQNTSAVNEAVQALQAETERLTGYPIRVNDCVVSPAGNKSPVELARDHGRDHHRVQLRPAYPKELQPYFLAGALMRIQHLAAARARGKRRLLLITPEHRRRLGEDQAAAVLGIVSPLATAATDMLFDSQLSDKIPVLRPVQFAALYALNRQLQQLWPPANPSPLHAKATALAGLATLFLDHLSGGVTDFAAHYQHLDGFDLSRKLWDHWCAKSPGMQPGDEFDVVDGFAEILGLGGTYEWVKADR
jgi:tetratricopeptide (TPR) repeat protein